jgi:hypothetical protein
VLLCAVVVALCVKMTSSIFINKNHATPKLHKFAKLEFNSKIARNCKIGVIFVG